MEQVAEQHTFVKDSIFKLKTYTLSGKRMFQNIFIPTRKFKHSGRLKSAPVLALSSTDLWNPNDTAQNWILTAGKIQNLRIAAQKLNGIVVKENHEFSFWRHIGNPNFGQGYVAGREIREGCIVPTIAGGLCQLSNALYDVALRSNFQITERHKHTQVIPGSLAEKDRDATVKWNYIDLRFQAKQDFRIEVELSGEKLLVQFRSEHGQLESSEDSIQQPAAKIVNDCLSCGNTACFKHTGKEHQSQQNTTYILDDKWSEFDAYITRIVQKEDQFIIPIKVGKILRTQRYLWKAASDKHTISCQYQGYYRALKLRYLSKQKNVFEANLFLDRKLAYAMAKKIPIQSNHVVVAQNLLPFLYESGALGGRTYDVLMTRLPFDQLHQRLDAAAKLYPQSKTLQDFRVRPEWIELENQALKNAKKLVTPHADLARLFSDQVAHLKWEIPTLQPTKGKGSKVLFPASALARKGAFEVRHLAQELELKLVVAGKAVEEPGFWGDVAIEPFTGNWEDVALVLYPCYVEHQPRMVLRAVAKGIPVLTTSACGLEPSNLVQLIDFNVNEPREKILEIIEKNAVVHSL